MNAIKPKILRGAFVEFGLSLPPLIVVFQYNPLQLTRNRSLTFAPPAMPTPRATRARPNPQTPEPKSMREFHDRTDFDDLDELRRHQIVTVNEPTIGFDIRLDATDKLDGKDDLTTQFGISPQLSTLELMVYPKGEGVLGAAVSALLGKPKDFLHPRRSNPPLILFIFGRKRVLPVNINSLNITETEFSADLNPIRATVAVQLTVIEGKNPPFVYSHTMTEAMSLLNLANIGDVANVVIPG
ncbi:hypothetical protein [Nocardia bovistercoris]|uniref:Uncharacterized protein n=1 Tax=Nocardia bovistercoris TaxID=2785916 RepID=A0A931N2I7_9NOCA|nr:hypothetical protein [Nocardia bovistercoris]MBH0775553.1 hypothetical protein [Nocardia bovistercoris]